MQNYPDFSSCGYEIEKILGKNTVGGRVTYLALWLRTNQRVVIKQYQFAQSGLSWMSYQAYRSEIKILSSLYSNNIPRYLDSFETKTGFCLVQEYKNALSLEQSGPFEPLDIREIAIAILEILIYLQTQTPPVIHGDLKPENILIDPHNLTKIYLVDFGFARMGSGEMTASKVVKGTLGFMPPEEMFNRTLSKASDLYSLGVTLICLLTKTPSDKIGELIDEKTSQLKYKHKLPKLHPQFIRWLDRMIAPAQNDRFANAQIAMKELYSLPIVPKRLMLSSLQTVGKKPYLPLGLGGIALAGLLIVSGVFYQKSQKMQNLLQSKTCPQCHLPGLTLTKAQLKSANLLEANLEGANLKNSNLSLANLENANLEGANLEGVNLTHANLEGAKLKDVNLRGANLQGANLNGATLENGILVGANLTKVNLKNANLINSQLKDARLIEARLEGANLAGANLAGANLEEATMPDGKKYAQR